MKTIREIAEITGVSKTAIYTLIKNHNIPTIKTKGLTQLDDNSVNLILAHYSNAQYDTIKDIIENSTFSTKVDNVENEIENVESEAANTHIINILEKQLDEKQEVIRGLMRALENEQQLKIVPLISGTKSHNISSEEDEQQSNKKSFWLKIFKK